MNHRASGEPQSAAPQLKRHSVRRLNDEMSLESLGNVGEFIGGLAVIASLIYLAVQIRQNTTSLRLQARQALKRDQFELRRSAIENPDVAELFSKATSDFDALSPSDRIRVNMICASVMEHHQQLFLLRSQGLVHWESLENVLRGHLALEPYRRWWTLGRQILEPEFVEYVERDVLPIADGSKLHWQP